MRTIAEITIELEAAATLLRNLRDERKEAILAKCPYKPGSEFEMSGRKYLVRSISPWANGSGVWLTCDYWTTAKKWSQSTQMVNLKVED